MSDSGKMSFSLSSPKLFTFHGLNLAKKQLLSEESRRPVPTRATQGYNTGDFITSCRPFSKALHESCKGKLCDYCLDVNKTHLQRCKACGSFYYCSKECQIADWNAAHKFKECNLYKKDKARILVSQPALCRLVARLYLILRNSKNNKNQSGDHIEESSEILYKDFTCFNGHKRNFLELISHFDKIKSSAVMVPFWQFKNIYKKILSLRYDWCSDDLLVIMGIINSNAFEIAKIPEKPLAYGLFVETAIFDHSCEANARFVFEKDEMKLLAFKPIKSGDEIYIHYTDPEPRDEFYTIMKSTHYFTCNCPFCQKLTPLERDKFEFNVLRRTYHGHSYRGSLLLGMLTLKKMIALSKKWPNEEHFNTDIENLLALQSLAQLGDSVDSSAFGVPSFGEIYEKRHSIEAFGSLSSGLIQLADYVNSCRNYKIAEKNYMTGDYIRDGIPCFYVVLPQHKKQNCNLCLANLTGSVIYTCDTCQKFNYCSVKCQKSDIIIHQPFECLLNSKDTDNTLQDSKNAEMSLYLRMYMSIKNQRINFHFRDEKVYANEADDGLEGMTTNKNGNSNKNKITYKVFCKNTNILPSRFGNPLFDILDFIEQTWTEYTVEYDRLAEIFMFALSNMFRIYDSRTNESIAIGSFTSYRLTEHSLEPNSEYLLQKGKLSLRAKKTISQGAPINVGYH